MHLSRDHCSALRERMGMDCLVSLMRSVLLIALMLDCGGRRESEKGSEGEGGRWGERKRESAEGMHPQGARLGLGQGFRNAPQEILVKARAGLEECSSRELRVEAGWGRARGMFPQSTPLTLEQKWRGSTGGECSPVPPPAPGWLRIRFPCGDQHPADRALGCPGEETGGWRHCYSIGLSKNTSQMLCLTVSLHCLYSLVLLLILHGERETVSVVWLLFSVGTRHVRTLDMRLQW